MTSLRPLAIVAAACAWGAGGCASDATIVSLSVTSPDPLLVRVGERVRLVVRAVDTDGGSTDVTNRATCTLSGQQPPGVLEGAAFVAEAPGTTDVTCTYRGAQGSLAVTVEGFRMTTIADIQRGQLQVGTMVEIQGVVTGRDPEPEYESFWLQDEGGGEYSGIYARDVREPGGAAVAVGDRVTVRGAYAERSGRSVVNFTEVVVDGAGDVVVDVLDIADVAPDPWDGCLVAVEDVEVLETVVDDYYWRVAAAADLAGPSLLVDTLLHDPPIAVGLALDRVTGPVIPFDGGVAIAPRGPDDVRADEIATTVSDLYDGTVSPGTVVTLTGLAVTALDPLVDSTAVDLFAQVPAGGAASGVYVRDFLPAPHDAAEGSSITVTGLFSVDRGRHTIDASALSVDGTAEAAVRDVDIAVDDLGDFESTLVRVADLRVVDPDASAFTWSVEDARPGGAAVIEIDTLWVPDRPAAGDRVASITGVVFCTETGCALAPRRSGDVVFE